MQFHMDNPHVYQILVELARNLKAAGHKRLGIRMLWETMRYELMTDTIHPKGFKLNDHYHSRYARLIMEQEPDLDGIFETRKLRSA